MRIRRGILFLLLICGFIILLPITWRIAVKQHYMSRIYDLNKAPAGKVAIVFGAAVLRDGRLSTVLRDRMETAIHLYKHDRAQQILVSGARNDSGRDEPEAMKAYALGRGIPEDAIIVDYSGFRTFETCYRAKEHFGLDSATLVTQVFHLPRALFICDMLGIEVVGVAADLRSYRAGRWYEFRETAATVIALFDVAGKRKPAVLSAPATID